MLLSNLDDVSKLGEVSNMAESNSIAFELEKSVTISNFGMLKYDLDKSDPNRFT